MRITDDRAEDLAEAPDEGSDADDGGMAADLEAQRALARLVPQWVSLSDAARITGAHERTLRKWYTASLPLRSAAPGHLFRTGEVEHDDAAAQAAYHSTADPDAPRVTITWRFRLDALERVHKVRGGWYWNPAVAAAVRVPPPVAARLTHLEAENRALRARVRQLEQRLEQREAARASMSAAAPAPTPASSAPAPARRGAAAMGWTVGDGLARYAPSLLGPYATTTAGAVDGASEDGADEDGSRERDAAATLPLRTRVPQQRQVAAGSMRGGERADTLGTGDHETAGEGRGVTVVEGELRLPAGWVTGNEFAAKHGLHSRGTWRNAAASGRITMHKGTFLLPSGKPANWAFSEEDQASFGREFFRHPWWVGCGEMLCPACVAAQERRAAAAERELASGLLVR